MPERRLSVRVTPAFKQRLHQAVQALQDKGANTTQSELVQMLVDEGLTTSPDELDDRLRAWRRSRP